MTPLPNLTLNVTKPGGCWPQNFMRRPTQKKKQQSFSVPQTIRVRTFQISLASSHQHSLVFVYTSTTLCGRKAVPMKARDSRHPMGSLDTALTEPLACWLSWQPSPSPEGAVKGWQVWKCACNERRAQGSDSWCKGRPCEWVWALIQDKSQRSGREKTRKQKSAWEIKSWDVNASSDYSI